MKNFLRALRHALPYRRRLVLSIVCALLAAVLWGANFTSIYPVLKLLHTGQTPQAWVDQRIDSNQKEIDKLKAIVDKLNQQDKELKEQRPADNLVKRQRDLAKDLSKYEGRLETARSWQLRNHLMRKYIYALLPNDCFQTLVWLILAVFVGLAIKCFFEFAQEWLVGSVVNLTLYDLRNRFYRNVIHLDVDQFGEQGTSELMARFTNDMESLGTGTKTRFGKVVAEPLRALSCVVVACIIRPRRRS